MSVQTIIKNTVNLDEPIAKKILRDTLGSQDDQAHKFEVTVKSGNEAVDLTGAEVYGYFIRAGGETVIITGGIENGTAYVVLSENCYRVPGHFSFAMKIQLGTVRHTVLWYEGSVGLTSSDSIVDPENIVPSLEELLAQIDAVEQATDRANTAAEASEQAKANADEATDRANTAAQAAESVANMTAQATTLEPGSEATASYSGGVLSIGVPKGEKGDKGDKGDTGSASPITVNGIAAIDDNITLTAEDVGAMPDTYVAPVDSVNGKTGTVTLAAEDVGAMPDTYVAPVSSVNGQTGAVVLQTSNPLDCYPVGALYWSSVSTSPASLFGGTWSQIKDKFVLAAGSTYSNGGSGGAATVTLTTSQIPSHNHGFLDHWQTAKGSDTSRYSVALNGDGAGSSSVSNTRSYTASTGGSAAHENMPPYIVKYCWERTA